MKKTFITFFSILIIILSFSFFSVAAENAEEKSFLIISHHSEFESFPEGGFYGIENIASDFESGADMVAFSFEPEWTHYTGRLITTDELLNEISLIIKSVPDGKAIILDDAWNHRGEIEKLAESLDAADKVILRTDKSTKELQNESCSLRTISVYSGGIVFSAEQRIKYAKPSDMIQFQSKNYFNPFYQKLFTNYFSVSVIAPMFDKNLCGQRDDSITGWDEMIERGYTAIETSNPEGLVNYRDQINTQRASLSKDLSNYRELIGRQGEMYSSASLKKLNDCCSNAEKCLAKLSSLGELQSCAAELKNAREKLTLSYGTDTTLGAWNITSGKIIASVLCALGLIGFEMFLIKKREK